MFEWEAVVGAEDAEIRGVVGDRAMCESGCGERNAGKSRRAADTVGQLEGQLRQLSFVPPLGCAAASLNNGYPSQQSILLQ